MIPHLMGSVRQMLLSQALHVDVDEVQGAHHPTVADAVSKDSEC